MATADLTVPATRFCKHCQTEKPLESFFAKKDGRHGRAVKCAACVIEYSKNWRAANPDRIKALSLDYYVRTKAEHLNRAAAWQKENPREAQARNRRWKEGNPEAMRAISRNRRARQALAIGTHTADDVAELQVMQKYRCAACSCSIKDGFHVDHRQPLALGGSNDKSNLQLLCPTCNMSKGAKDPMDFMQSRGFLL